MRFTISIPGSAGTLRVVGGVSSGEFGAGTVKQLDARDSIRATFTDEEALDLALTLLREVRDSQRIREVLTPLGSIT